MCFNKSCGCCDAGEFQKCSLRGMMFWVGLSPCKEGECKYTPHTPVRAPRILCKGSFQH